MHGNKLDDTDIRILEILQKRARTKRGQLAEDVGLSIPTISERLHKLERYGFIKGYHAALDPMKIELGITAYIHLTTHSAKHYQEIIDAAEADERVMECHTITGSGSHLLKVRTIDTKHLEALLTEIQSWPGIVNTRTDIVLSTGKETANLPLQHLRTKQD